jgi:hypothetical protein
MHRQDLPLGNGALILHAGEFADGEGAVLVEDRALGPKATERRASASEVGEIGGGFGPFLDGARRIQELTQFKQGWSRTASSLRGAAEDTSLIPKTQGTDPAAIVHGEKVVHCAELGCARLRTGLAGVVAAFGMVAKDDAPTPTVRFGICNGPVENRAIRNPSVKLWAADKRQARFDREAL